jgi:hypothetical protein
MYLKSVGTIELKKGITRSKTTLKSVFKYLFKSDTTMLVVYCTLKNVTNKHFKN